MENCQCWRVRPAACRFGSGGGGLTGLAKFMNDARPATKNGGGRIVRVTTMQSIRISTPSLLAGLLVAGPLALVGCAGGDRPELNVMIGVGDLNQDDDGGEPAIFSQADYGGQFAIGLVSPPLDNYDGNGSGFRVGGRLNFTFTREDGFERTVAGEPLLTIEDFADLSLVSPQIVGSYRQTFGDEYSGFFLEPGIGVGPSLGFMSFGSDFEFGNTTIGTDIDETEFALGFAANPFFRLGYDGNRWLIGAESGYQYTAISFDDDLGGNVDNWYIGLFLGFELGE